MEIYQCPEFSIGIFLIKPHKHMPFHDHPGMYGVMKVLFSSMTVTSYSKLEGQATPTQGIPVRCRFLSQLSLDSKSEPCVLYPEQGNIHQIQAGEEAVAFIDILAPPYNPKEGRDCNYYEKMETKEDDKQNISLMPGPNPSWFSCVPLSYNGPCPS
ncbi:2-aminoethanethiol dioxygenase [Geodia barretti]|nr:2-aminoethanethiol dioxygenase [Geodia barretti]